MSTPNHDHAVELLLIEPVWNRNRQDLECFKFRRGLLIEPVWNRNTASRLYKANGLTFNRTSLESKQVIQPLRSSHITLLIEPVWNRNHINDA